MVGVGEACQARRPVRLGKARRGRKHQVERARIAASEGEPHKHVLVLLWRSLDSHVVGSPNMSLLKVV